MMKNLLWFFIFSCFSISITAQNIILYGMRSNNPSQLATMELVQVDPFTGITTSLFEIQNSFAVAAGSSTFDHSNGTYIYWGPDDQQTYRIFSVDVDDQTTQTNPSTTDHPIELEFDLETGITYGIASGSSTNTSLIAVDLQDGSSQIIAALPDVSGIAIGSSTFDSNNKQYIFLGADNSNNFRLYTVDINTGMIVNSPIVNEQNTDERISSFEYDNKTNTLYGLYNEIDSTMFDPYWQMYYRKAYLAEIDIVTGDPLVLGNVPILEGYFLGVQVGGVAYDQMSGTYIMRGSDDSGFKLLTVNSSDGLVISAIASPNNIAELQVDNIVFASAFYVVSSNENNEQIGNVKLYPNPVNDDLNIEIEGEKYSNINIEIRNVLGQLIRKEDILDQSSFGAFSISVEDLAEGNYMIFLMENEDVIKVGKFVKR